MKTQRYAVAYATDTQFWTHTCISAYSLLTNNPNVQLDLYVLIDTWNATITRDVEFLKRNHPDLRIHHVPVDDSLFDDAPVGEITKQSYYRLMLASLLPEDVKRVLYLDGDTIIRRPLNDLFSLDLGGHVLAAIHQPDEPGKPRNDERLGLPDGTPYFNAGVLLIDLDLWRQKDIESECLRYVYAHLNDSQRLQYHDQDTLNVVFANDWRRLNPTYNFNRWTYDPALHPEVAVSPSPLEELGPMIAHHAGSIKPWQGGSLHPYEYEYWDYRMKTPYASQRLRFRSRVVAIPRVLVGNVITVVRRIPWLNTRLLKLRSILRGEHHTTSGRMTP